VRHAKRPGASALVALALLLSVASPARAEADTLAMEAAATEFSYAGTWTSGSTYQDCLPDGSVCGPGGQPGASLQFELEGPCDGVGPCRVITGGVSFPFGIDGCATPRTDTVGYAISALNGVVSFRFSLGGTPASPTITGIAVAPVTDGTVVRGHTLTGATRSAPGSTTTSCSSDVVSPVKTTTTISFSHSGTCSRRGCKMTKIHVTGAVSPARPGKAVTVRLQVRRSGSWVTVATKTITLNNASKYKTTIRKPNGSRCRLVAVFPGDTTVEPPYLRSSASKTFAC
jgi:hypothetical protein